jgi:hypothetical protein
MSRPRGLLFYLLIASVGLESLSEASGKRRRMPLFYLHHNNQKCVTVDMPGETALDIHYHFPGKSACLYVNLWAA